MPAARPRSRRPAGAARLPLGPGRRRGPAQHERVAVSAACAVGGGPGSGAGDDQLAALSRPRGAPRLRSAIAEWHGVAPANVFAANGSNEVLQTLLLTYAGPGRTVVTFEPTYQLHSHIARVTGAAVVQGERRSDFTLDVDAAERVVADARPAVTFLCSPNNPTGLVEDPSTVRRLLGGGARPCRRRRGLCTVRRLERPRPRRRRRAVGCRAHVLQDVEHGGGPPRLPDRPDVARRRGPGGGVALSPRCREASGRPAGARPRRRDGCTRQARRRRAGAAQRGAGAHGGRRVPERRQLRAVPASAPPGHEVWQGLVDRGVLVRDCSRWSRLDDCLRVTVGTPEEDDRFLGAMRDVLDTVSS